MVEDDKDADVGKPWWESNAQLGTLAQIGLTGLLLVLLLAGIDLSGVLDKLLVASTMAAALWTFVGNVTRSQPIDPSLVAPGVHSESMAALVGALKTLTGRPPKPLPAETESATAAMTRAVAAYRERRQSEQDQP